jgi:hypothetical protein
MTDDPSEGRLYTIVAPTGPLFVQMFRGEGAVKDFFWRYRNFQLRRRHPGLSREIAASLRDRTRWSWRPATTTEAEAWSEALGAMPDGRRDPVVFTLPLGPRISGTRSAGPFCRAREEAAMTEQTDRLLTQLLLPAVEEDLEVSAARFAASMFTEPMTLDDELLLLASACRALFEHWCRAGLPPDPAEQRAMIWAGLVLHKATEPAVIEWRTRPRNWRRNNT